MKYERKDFSNYICRAVIQQARGAFRMYSALRRFVHLRVLCKSQNPMQSSGTVVYKQTRA